MKKERIVLVIDLMCQGVPDEQRIEVGQMVFVLQTHRIGWDFETATSLIKKYDGYVDGIALSGIRLKASVGKVTSPLPASVKLVRTAKKTPVYLGEDLRELFANWTLRRMLRDHPQMFSGKKALFHCAVATPFMNVIKEAGAEVSGADALLLTGAPFLLKGTKALQGFLKVSSTLNRFTAGRINPSKNKRQSKLNETLAKWVSDCDVFVTFGTLLEDVKDYSIFKDKIVIIDFIKKSVREKLSQAGVLQVVEFVPHHPELSALYDMPFSVMTAVIDQQRISEDTKLSFDEYVIRWTERLNVTPNRLKTSRGLPRRCAFIVHPLSQKDIWRAPALRKLSGLPTPVKDFSEKVFARLPVFYYGTLEGAVSQSSGQEVICDIFAITATPKQLLSMEEETVYRSIVRGIYQAQKKGAALLGLGAYTKVVGDAGVTISRRAPIPVTTGNSYSASTTLWAARSMVEKLGFVKTKGEKIVDGKAMIIGATGSIGRVAALLVSLVFDEVVLVATRPDKLLELRQEVLALSPKCRVITTVDPNPELVDTDLIVTATSNQSGTILDIEKVKPGAVICDCSRPLDITKEEAARRPDVLVIESGEVDLPGNPKISCDIGLPKPSVYACLAETVLLTMEGRYESFSLSRDLSWEKTKEIFKIGIKHGARLSAIRCHDGVVTDAQIEKCKAFARERLKSWPAKKAKRYRKANQSDIRLQPGLTLNQSEPQIESQQAPQTPG